MSNSEVQVVKGILQYCENLGVLVSQEKIASSDSFAISKLAIFDQKIRICYLNGNYYAVWDRKWGSISQLTGWINNKSKNGKEIWDYVPCHSYRYFVGQCGICKIKKKLAAFVVFNQKTGRNSRGNRVRKFLFDADSIAMVKNFLLGNTQNEIIIEYLAEKIPEFGESYYFERQEFLNEDLRSQSEKAT